MKVFGWILVGIIALYLLLSFVFVHLSLEHRKKIKTSDEIIRSHLKSHISLLELLIVDINKHFKFIHKIDPSFLGENNANLIEYINQEEQLIRQVITENKITFTTETNYLAVLEENIKRLRDEVFRYNSYVENFNIICGSFVFWPIVKLLKLRKKDKY